MYEKINALYNDVLDNFFPKKGVFENFRRPAPLQLLHPGSALK